MFEVTGTGNLTLNTVTLSGGLASDCPTLIDDAPGGACGGAIVNLGTLTVNSSRISNNAATNTAPGESQAMGEGVANYATFNVRTSRFNGNAISCLEEGCFSLGGAVYNSFEGTLDMKSTEFARNAASCSASDFCFGVGGAMVNDGISTIETSRVNGNTSSCSASGGIAIGGGTGNLGTMNLTNSQVIGNTASCSTSDCLALAGGVENCRGTLNVTHTRVADNTANAGRERPLWGCVLGLHDDPDPQPSPTTRLREMPSPTMEGSSRGRIRADR